MPKILIGFLVGYLLAGAAVYQFIHGLEAMIVGGLSAAALAVYDSLIEEPVLRKYRTALKKISLGNGVYGAQAGEYKNIARDALNKERV
jgi:hypothetical protein